MDPSSPANVAIIGSVIRGLLIAVGGIGLTGDQVSSLAGALAVIVGIAWSIWQKAHVAKTTVTHSALETAVTQAAANPQNAQAIIAAAKAGHF